MPWQDPLSPSIQLGALKAYVNQERPNVAVDTYNLFLELADPIDIHLAKVISRSWIGEALFAYMLFPQQAASISTYLEHAREDDIAFANIDYGHMIETLRTTLLARISDTDWSQYSFVGFTVVFAQTFSSLLAAREIKRRAPSVPIVFGGPGCTGVIGKSLLSNFDFLNYIINGEGEKPLVNLIDALGDPGRERPPLMRALVHRASTQSELTEVDQLANLTTLPPPDYDDYFDTLSRTRDPIVAKARVRIPVETNRGCWWDKSLVDPMQSCSFCNLNLQWHGYREKPTAQAISEIQQLVRRYSCPDFTIVDNILRHKNADEFIDGIAALDLGLDFWLEARASVKPYQIKRLKEVGGRVIQFGIESLSTSMLRKMVKGTTALQNLQAMKFCEQYGVKNTANVIIDFPGMDEDDINENLANIEFARCYYPLSVTEFSLVYQAPAYKQPWEFDIEEIKTYHMYSMLMPPELSDRLFLTEKSFTSAKLEKLRPMWAMVRQAIQDWTAHYERTRPMVEGNLLLSLQDGGDYLKIRDFRRPAPKFHWMSGVERDLYLECSAAIRLKDLYSRFPSISQEFIDATITKWVGMRLAFRESGRVMGLAVPWGPVSARRMSDELLRQPREREAALSAVL